MEQILSYFVFDVWGAGLLSMLLVVLIIQIVFYLGYYKKPVSYYNNPSYESESTGEKPSVSVIIISKNESENLAKNLPSILKQDYPDYEVIVVNDGSTDQSEELLKRLKLEYSHLYSTFSPEPPYEHDARKQKLLSMTIGIKAATKEVLLFTEADSAPLSQNWISSMISRLTPEKDIVIGYCNYETFKGIRGRIAVFDHLIFTLQYMSMAIKGKPYIGTYRNIAYRKKLFFENKGFSSSLKYENAQDIFLNSIMNENNTSVALSESSFVSSRIYDYKMWRFLKTSYMRAKSNFGNFKPGIFHIETISRYMFYVISILCLIYSTLSNIWLYTAAVMLIFLCRFLIQYSVLKKTSQHFKTKYFLFSIPLIDLLLPCFNFYFFRISKKRSRKKG